MCGGVRDTSLNSYNFFILKQCLHNPSQILLIMPFPFAPFIFISILSLISQLFEHTTEGPLPPFAVSLYQEAPSNFNKSADPDTFYSRRCQAHLPSSFHYSMSCYLEANQLESHSRTASDEWTWSFYFSITNASFPKVSNFNFHAVADESAVLAGMITFRAG